MNRFNYLIYILSYIFLQNGTMWGKSCLTQLIEYFENLEDALDNGNSMDAVNLDCKNAFNTIILSPIYAYSKGGVQLEYEEILLKG